MNTFFRIVKSIMAIDQPLLGDGGAERQSEARSVAEFMSITICDDLLFEILLRLPNSRTIIQCSTVCKRWYSLVSHSEYFIQKSNHYHRQKRHRCLGRNTSSSYSDHPLPYSLLIRVFYDGLSPGFSLTPLVDNLSSKKSNILQPLMSSPNATAGYLDFLDRGPSLLTILSSFEDLLLVERGLEEFYVCNPLTRQWIALPEPPATRQRTIRYRCGFVCESNKCSCIKKLGDGSDSYYCNCSIKYRVALVTMDDELGSLFRATIFYSETGEWSKVSAFQFPVRLNLWHLKPVGISSGIIYWPFGPYETQGVVAFDTRKGTDDSQRCRLISLPVEYDHGPKAKKERAILGVVRGRLRLSHFFLHEPANSFVLKAWELIESSSTTSSFSSWDLVHHVSLRRRNEKMFLIALHPEDGDAFFFKRKEGNDRDICQYKVGGDSCEHVCDFTNRILCVYPLVHMWWYTIIPPLPCT